MKSLCIIIVTIIFLLCSCNSEIKTTGQQVKFGIHEIVAMSELSDTIMDTLKALHVQIEKSQQQSVMGYLLKSDSMELQIDLFEQNLKLVRTLYPVDKEQMYYAVVAIRPNSVIDNTHIKKTIANGNNVEIYFNYEGAKRWAELTKKNIGKTIVFVVDNLIYAMPLINSEIKNGVALINNLENETFAKNVSESLNSGLSD